MAVVNKVFERVPEPIIFRSLAWQYRVFEPELGRLDEFVPRGGTAVDVGAWWGPWTYWLARRATRVVTIEPVGHLAEFLRRRAPSNVEVHNVALSDARGEAQLWVPTSGKGSEGRSSLCAPAGQAPAAVTVPTLRLDDLDVDDVRFVKIDVEGHEQAVLRGAAATIARDRPTLLIEIEQRDERDVSEVFEQVTALGYRGRFLDRRKWRPLDEFDRQAHQLQHQAEVQRRGYLTNMVFSRKYINNFLFEPR